MYSFPNSTTPFSAVLTEVLHRSHRKAGIAGIEAFTHLIRCFIRYDISSSLQGYSVVPLPITSKLASDKIFLLSLITLSSYIG